MYSFEPNELSIPQVHQYLLGGVSPRPIAFVSTISDNGTPNLAPFSFFNAFGANPPIVAFSPARRGRDNTVKDTYNNLMSNGECVIHIVTYNLITRVNLASCEYDEDVNEFIKANLTQLKSDLVKPFRVKESPFHMECKLMQMIELGGKAGSGNLAICEVVKFHINESIIDNGSINPYALDAVARNGANYYTRANDKAIFELPKPNVIGIGIDCLPEVIKNSEYYSGRVLGNLGMNESLPGLSEVSEYYNNFDEKKGSIEHFEIYESFGDWRKMLSTYKYMMKNEPKVYGNLIERIVNIAADKNDVTDALKIALIKYYNL